MPVTGSFLEFVLEQLDMVGPIVSKRMFGGVGLYAGDTFFALLAGDVLYLKVDDSTRAEFERVGGRAFQPFPDRPGTMQYYNLPVGILEDSDELTRWARKSIAVARARRANPPARRRAVTRKRPATRSRAAAKRRR